MEGPVSGQFRVPKEKGAIKSKSREPGRGQAMRDSQIVERAPSAQECVRSCPGRKIFTTQTAQYDFLLAWTSLDG